MKIWFENGAERARISAFFCATAPLFFTLAPPQPAAPFSVCATGAVALKVAQVPSTAHFESSV